MSLRQAATLGAAQTATTMALSFISVKVTSVFLGPAGLGTLGQFTYFITMTQAVLAAGLNIGLVRRTAELGDDRPARERVVSTVLRALVIAGIPVALVIAASSGWLARELLQRVGQLAEAEIVEPALIGRHRRKSVAQIDARTLGIFF